MERRIRQKAIQLFVTYGPKRISLDELARQLGISKKSIYKYFINKNQLVYESVEILLEDIRMDTDRILRLPIDPVQKLLRIYCNIFKWLQTFTPAFLFETRKYFPEAFALIEASREDLIHQHIIPLLHQAKATNMIRADLDEELFACIHLSKISLILNENNLCLKDHYSLKAVFEHMVTNNIRGVLNPHYRASFEGILQAC